MSGLKIIFFACKSVVIFLFLGNSLATEKNPNLCNLPQRAILQCWLFDFWGALKRKQIFLNVKNEDFCSCIFLDFSLGRMVDFLFILALTLNSENSLIIARF